MAIEKLNEIKLWFEKQRTYHFYAASILVIYESDLENISMDEQKTIEQIKHLVRVKLADFAHVFPSNNQRDENFLFAIISLIDHFKRLLDSNYNYQDPRVNILNVNTV